MDRQRRVKKENKIITLSTERFENIKTLYTNIKLLLLLLLLCNFHGNGPLLASFDLNSALHSSFMGFPRVFLSFCVNIVNIRDITSKLHGILLTWFDQFDFILIYFL